MARERRVVGEIHCCGGGEEGEDPVARGERVCGRVELQLCQSRMARVWGGRYTLKVREDLGVRGVGVRHFFRCSISISESGVGRFLGVLFEWARGRVIKVSGNACCRLGVTSARLSNRRDLKSDLETTPGGFRLGMERMGWRCRTPLGNLVVMGRSSNGCVVRDWGLGQCGHVVSRDFTERARIKYLHRRRALL